ncbi:hypothetical protein HWI79_2031 [Cryptosporidium felis]|nr:hypothetical protein HWI79_2031 [Cryptosporidium felis]
MAPIALRLKIQSYSLILLSLISLSIYGISLGASSPPKKDPRPVRFVQPGLPPFVASSNPGTFFKHIQTTVEQDSSSSPETSKAREPDSPSKSVRPKYRFVHAPVGYQKSTESLQAEIERLKELNSKLNLELAEKNAEIRDLSSENQRLREKSEAALKKAESKGSKIKAMSEEIKAKEDLRAESERASEIRKEEISLLKQKIQEKESVLASKELLLNGLRLQLNQKGIELDMTQKELEKAKLQQSSDEIKLRKEIEELHATNREAAERQLQQSNEKEILESKIEELTSEIQKLKSLYQECTEALGELESKLKERASPVEQPIPVEKPSIPEQIGTQEPVKPKGSGKAPYEAVLRQLGNTLRKEKWVKGSPLRHPDQLPPEASLEPELKAVFRHLKEKKEEELKEFVNTNGLEHLSRKEQKIRQRAHKEAIRKPPPGNIRDIPRVKKTTSDE